MPSNTRSCSFDKSGYYRGDEIRVIPFQKNWPNNEVGDSMDCQITPQFGNPTILPKVLPSSTHVNTEQEFFYTIPQCSHSLQTTTLSHPLASSFPITPEKWPSLYNDAMCCMVAINIGFAVPHTMSVQLLGLL